ncbi:hypothetical protein B0A55_09823 [Friedmanniomyces simplex]|uniref:Carboxylic ester hydrolase n=1 Tax=Friedmanniomyces simplex TaxID=329884 RepID=A0A4U0X7V8_9PEZI|nr:hypothetical protein B0A55_09823 [Friedmanniomyces simplex]
MRASILCAILSFISTTLATLAKPTVAITNGTVQGLPANKAGIKTFLGIPFAAPPVGSLRWQSPQPATAFRGTYNATAFGASCYSADLVVPQIGPVSEDCLTVNLWTAAKSAGPRRPVMVWIFGGGFQFGSSNSPLYNGSKLAEHDVIVVTFNYRLGVFGFLGLAELDRQGTPSGDYGLQDQLAALRWVKENIAAFGGDPENVTVFGQSAGAHSIGLLLASPLSAGLFNKTILESGAYWDSEHGSIRTFNEARAQGAAFQMQVGAASVAELRAISAETLNSAALWNASTDPGLTAFAPSIDNYVVPDVPAEMFDSGKAQNVPLLAGFTAAEEDAFLLRVVPHSTPAQYNESAGTVFGSNATAFLSRYPRSTEVQANQSALALLGDLVIREQTFEAIDRQYNVNGQDVV